MSQVSNSTCIGIYDQKVTVQWVLIIQSGHFDVCRWSGWMVGADGFRKHIDQRCR